MLLSVPPPSATPFVTAGALSPTTLNPYAPYAQLAGGNWDGFVLPLTLSLQSGAPTNTYNATWFLVINAIDEAWVTFTATDDPADTAVTAEHPWIHIPSSAATVSVLGPLMPGQTTTGGSAATVSNVRNFGTGPLHVSPTSVPDSSGGDVVIINAATIAAAGVGSIGLDVTAGDGLSALAVDVTSNDTVPGTSDYHNAQLSVSAEVSGIPDTVLVLDASGSMLRRPDGAGVGNPMGLDPESRRRWDNLVAATSVFIDGYVDFLTATGASPDSRIGLAVFPDVLNKTSGWRQRAGTLFPSQAISTPNTKADLHTALLDAGAAIEPNGMTPVGDALAVAMGADSTSTGMYDSSVADHRRWMVLMTDGAHNAGTTHPNDYIDSTNEFTSKEVRLFSIGYTTAATGTAVDMLKDLAENAHNPIAPPPPDESRYLAAPTTTGFAKGLADTFLEALIESIGLDGTYDPVGELDGKHRIAVHEFEVSAYDRSVGVFVDWASPSEKRISIALISPRCKRYDADALEAHADFQYRNLRSYAYAYISQEMLEGEGGYGTWKLEVTLGPHDPDLDIDQESPEPYRYNIVTRSGIRLVASAKGSRWRTGEPIEITARLEANGAPIPTARVVAKLDTPAADYGTLLAATELDRKAILDAVGDQQAGDIAGTWAIKVQALAAKYGTLKVPRSQREIELQEVTPGVYRGTITPTTSSGVYLWRVVATGMVGDVSFRRERALTSEVEALPHPKYTEVTFELAPDGHLIVRVRPRDEFGNAVLFDPAFSERMQIDVEGGKAATALVNMFDGTYTQLFSLSEVDKPRVRVAFDGKLICGPSSVPHPGAMAWMDRVVKYKEGVHSGGNTDPKAALGPIVGRDDPHVCIGGGGAIELTTQRGRLSASHVVVFTSADTEAAYVVYVRQARRKHVVPIGKGVGPIAVFEVPPWGGPLESVIVANPAKGAKGCVRLQAVGFVARRPKPRLSTGITRPTRLTRLTRLKRR